MYHNRDTEMEVILMAKDAVVSARVEPKVKEQAEEIFSKLGLSMSQAIKMFLVASIQKQGLPFQLTLMEDDDEEDWNFACAIATVDGGPEPSEYAKKIFLLYKHGDIDVETAKFALTRYHQNPDD